MTPTLYNDMAWAEATLYNWPSWIENQVVPNLPGAYGRGLLPQYYDDSGLGTFSSYPVTESGFPEMPQPATYSNSYGVEAQPNVYSINPSYGQTQQTNEKLGWNDVHEGFGVNSTTFSSVGNVISDISGAFNKERQLRQAEQGYQYQAQALANQAESSYKIAGVNMMRLRGNQENYLTQQRVSAVRTGFAPTSGSIEAVQLGTMNKFEQQILDAEREAEQSRQNTMYRSQVASWRAGQARASAKKARTSAFGSIIGATIGAVVGGPVGMAIGSKLGSSLGGF